MALLEVDRRRMRSGPMRQHRLSAADSELVGFSRLLKYCLTLKVGDLWTL